MATAFAVYSSDDYSLNFYNRDIVPSVGETFEGKTVSNVYTGVDNTSRLWASVASLVQSVTVVDGFAPKSMSLWFYSMSSLQNADLGKLDTSNIIDMGNLFYGCRQLVELDLSGFNMSAVKYASSMFASCSSLESLDLSAWYTPQLSNTSSMFSGCTSLRTIYVSHRWDSSKIYSSLAMFNSCSKLVGGNGTVYNSGYADASYARLDTEDAPGYFTFKQYYPPEAGADFMIRGTILYDIADSIRFRSGGAEPILVGQYPAAIESLAPSDALVQSVEQSKFPFRGIPPKSIAYGAKKYIGVASGKLTAALSTDGMMWDEVSLPTTGFDCITYGSAGFVATSPYSSTVAYSADGETWSTSQLPDSLTGAVVAYGNGKYVVFGSLAQGAYAAYSTTATGWNKMSIPTARDWKAVAYGTDRFVAISADAGVVAYSTDGVSWFEVTVSGMPMMESVAFGNGYFVAVGDSKIYYSTNGANWTQASHPELYSFVSVAYGAGTFVAVSQSNQSVTLSADGINWSEAIVLPTRRTWRTVVFGAGRFLLTADCCQICYRSFDGATWLDAAQIKLINHGTKEDKTAAIIDALASTGAINKVATGVLEIPSGQSIMGYAGPTGVGFKPKKILVQTTSQVWYLNNDGGYDFTGFYYDEELGGTFSTYKHQAYSGTEFFAEGTSTATHIGYLVPNDDGFSFNARTTTPRFVRNSSSPVEFTWVCLG